MAARTTMSDLIAYVRRETGAGTAAVTVAGVSYFADTDLQDYLDRHRCRHDFMPLLPIEKYSAGGSISWYEYQACEGMLEKTDGGTALFVVQDSTGAVIGTADYSVDYQVGLVTFTANQGGSARYLTARSYDVPGACADVLDAWATNLSLQFGFSSDGQTFQRQQQADMLRRAAQDFRRRARPTVGRLERTDTPVEGYSFADGRGTRNQRWARRHGED